MKGTKTSIPSTNDKEINVLCGSEVIIGHNTSQTTVTINWDGVTTGLQTFTILGLNYYKASSQYVDDLEKLNDGTCKYKVGGEQPITETMHTSGDNKNIYKYSDIDGVQVTAGDETKCKFFRVDNKPVAIFSQEAQTVTVAYGSETFTSNFEVGIYFFKGEVEDLRTYTVVYENVSPD